MEGLLVDKLTLCTSFTTGGKLHSLIKVIIVDDTGYRLNLGLNPSKLNFGSCQFKFQLQVLILKFGDAGGRLLFFFG